jgi:amino acid transporter
MLITGYYRRTYVSSPNPWRLFHDSEPDIITSNWICMRMGFLVQVSSPHIPAYVSCVTLVPNEAVAMKEIMYYWTPAQKVPEGVWIAVFIFLPFAFNFLNVRRYGEVEYWLTMIKIVTLVTLFILGVVFLPLGINEGGPLLATNGTTPVLCPTSIINNETCLLRPGFNCMSHCA